MKEKKIDGFFVHELEIIKKTNDGGDVFCHPSGAEVNVCNENFEGLISSALQRFQVLLGLLDKDAYKYVFAVVFKAFEFQVKELFYSLEDKIGTINYTTVAHGDPIYRDGRVVDVKIMGIQDMKVNRTIIEIDEELCNGCGQCAIACAEGAIKIIDGKAKVVSDNLCDGLGACIGECPEDALKIMGVQD